MSEKSFKKSEATNIMRLYERGFTTAEIAEGLGISQSAVSQARAKNECLFVHNVAAEALLRRMGKEGADKIFLVKVPFRHIETFSLMVEKVFDIKPVEVK